MPSQLEWVRDQVAAYESSGGTEANTLRELGIPVIIVTMMGRSGKVRKIALMRVEHEGEYALIASYGGAPQHPAWYGNIVANPMVEIQDGPEPFDYDVREVTGDERATWFERGVSVYPPYAEYQEKTDRLIPVLVATKRPVQLRNNVEAGRYELTIDGELASSTQYRDRGDVVEFPHTLTEEAHRGQGYAEQVVRFALDDILSKNATVNPRCWFVAQVIDDHPQYAPLVSAN